jgi:hypothetical protein
MTPVRFRPLLRATLIPLVIGLPVGPLAAQDWVQATYEALPAATGRVAGGLTAAPAGLNAGTGSSGRTANFGPLALNLAAFGEVEYSDNVRLDPAGEAGLTVAGGLRFDATYAFSRLQDLSLRGTFSTHAPVVGPGRRERLFSVSPDSALRFNLWIRQLRVSPFLRYSRHFDPVLSPVVNDTVILDQAAVTTGVQADLPLHAAGVQLLFLRDRRSQQGDRELSRTAWSDVAALRLVRRLTPGQTLIADFAVNSTTMVGGPADDARLLSLVLTDEWLISRRLTLRAGAGITRHSYRGSRLASDTTAATRPVYSVAVSHEARSNLSYDLRYQRSLQDGVGSNFYRLDELTFAPRYRFSEAFHLEAGATHQWIRESGRDAEIARRWTASLGVGVDLNARLNLRLGLGRTIRSSNDPLRRYGQNRLTFQINQAL